MGSDILEALRRFRVRKTRSISAVLSVVIVASICATLIAHGRNVSQKSAAPATAEHTPASATSSGPGAAIIDLVLMQNSRPIFPYSIIPGGVSSTKELKSAIESDPVVASHYSGFNLAKARVTRVEKDLPAYVSYRMGSKVYWTSRKLVIRAGEYIITDGHHLARARCGNRLSETAVKPIISNEPPIAELETPPFGDLSFSPDGPVATWIPSRPLGPEGAPPGSGSGGFFPPIVPIFIGGGGGGSPTFPSHKTPARNPVPPVPPVNPTPEPGTLLLVATGISGAYSMRRKFKLPKD